jgi:hypothetical protein
MRWLTFLLLPISFQALSAELDTLARIGAQMEQYPVVRSEFVQSKQMPALKRPLIMSGRFIFSRRHGVLWQIEQPYRMSYVLGEERIIEIAADGTRRDRGLRDVPGLAQVGRVFRAMIGADMAALSELFEVNVKGGPDKWDIELKPRQAQLEQFLSGLQLTGGHFVESIRLNEASGATTQIRFRNTQGASVPNEAELQLFGQELRKP